MALVYKARRDGGGGGGGRSWREGCSRSLSWQGAVETASGKRFFYQNVFLQGLTLSRQCDAKKGVRKLHNDDMICCATANLACFLLGFFAATFGTRFFFP